MRTNPRACLQVDEITDQTHWVSVIADGRYQELREGQFSDELSHARNLLAKHERFWQTPMAERQLKSGDALIEPIFFRIQIDSVTGLRSY
jgi:hypothetical protein